MTSLLPPEESWGVCRMTLPPAKTPGQVIQKCNPCMNSLCPFDNVLVLRSLKLPEMHRCDVCLYIHLNCNSPALLS